MQFIMNCEETFGFQAQEPFCCNTLAPTFRCAIPSQDSAVPKAVRLWSPLDARHGRLWRFTMMSG